ncbi:MAG TPA: 50S ribosomal protein L4 [Phycisphaerales bacterium]|nr:50S ribosomal protein L4 [Phycisphaerales bacterium]
MDVPVLNMKGVEVGKLAVDAETLGGEVNASLIKQAYVMYHANLRRGTSRTLNRENVEGSTKKFLKQKGSGGARHGDRKVPHFRGGGHAHHKQRDPSDYRKDMPKKMRRKANLNALLAKLIDNEVKVLDTLALGAPRTKDFVAFLGAIKAERSALVAVGLENDSVRKSARNLDNVTLVPAHQLTCFDMLNHRYLVITRADLEAFLRGPSSQITKAAKVNPLGRAKAAKESV